MEEPEPSDSPPQFSRADEERDLSRAREGDLEAFDRLVRLHLPRIHSLLLRMIGNHQDAEDLAQDTFVRAQRSLASFRGSSGLGTWLYRIAVHLSHDHLRRRGPRPAALPTEQNEPASPAETPHERAERRELEAHLEEALAALPHRQRAALVLRTQEGLAYDAIAEVLECSPQTARVHVMKARRAVAEAIEGRLGAEEDR